MKFVVDLDSTLLEMPVLERACSDLGRPGQHTMLDARDWCFTTIQQDVRARVYELFSDPEFMCTLPVRSGAQAFVAQLCRKGHDVWIATCRDKAIHERTAKQIAELFPDVAAVLLEASSSKMQIYLKIGPDVVVDDSPANVAAAVMAGVPCVLMYSSADTPYNWRFWGGFGIDMEGLLELAENDSWKDIRHA